MTKTFAVGGGAHLIGEITPDDEGEYTGEIILREILPPDVGESTDETEEVVVYRFEDRDPEVVRDKLTSIGMTLVQVVERLARVVVVDGPWVESISHNHYIMTEAGEWMEFSSRHYHNEDGHGIGILATISMLQGLGYYEARISPMDNPSETLWSDSGFMSIKDAQLACDQQAQELGASV